MLGVFAARVLYAEFINNQTEDNGTGGMGEETRTLLCQYVTVLVGMLDESIVDERASMGKTVYAFADLDENMSVVDEGLELVLLHDAGWNDFDGDSHIFVIVSGSVQVKYFDVDRREFCIGSGQNAVEEALGTWLWLSRR
jgi:hypothetical protein